MAQFLCSFLAPFEIKKQFLYGVIIVLFQDLFQLRQQVNMLSNSYQRSMPSVNSSIVHGGIFLAAFLLFNSCFLFCAKPYIAPIKLLVALYVIGLIMLATVTMFIFVIHYFILVDLVLTIFYRQKASKSRLLDNFYLKFKL